MHTGRKGQREGRGERGKEGIYIYTERGEEREGRGRKGHKEGRGGREINVWYTYTLQCTRSSVHVHPLFSPADDVLVAAYNRGLDVSRMVAEPSDVESLFQRANHVHTVQRGWGEEKRGREREGDREREREGERGRERAEREQDREREIEREKEREKEG